MTEGLLMKTGDRGGGGVPRRKDHLTVSRGTRFGESLSSASRQNGDAKRLREEKENKIGVNVND